MFLLPCILQNVDVDNKRAHSSKILNLNITPAPTHPAFFKHIQNKYSDFTWQWRKEPLGHLKFMRSLEISFIMLTICTASFQNGLDWKRWTDVVERLLPVVCAELCELLLLIRYPGGLLNVLGYIELQIFSCGLISILNHKFVVDLLLSGQTSHTQMELRAVIDFLLNKTHISLKYKKCKLESLYEANIYSKYCL